MKIEVKSVDVNVKAGTSKKTGKPYSIREQGAYLFVEGEPYPQRCVLQLGDEQAPYGVGLYDTADEMRVGAFGRLEVSRSMRLVGAASRKAA